MTSSRTRIGGRDLALIVAIAICVIGAPLMFLTTGTIIWDMATYWLVPIAMIVVACRLVLWAVRRVRSK